MIVDEPTKEELSNFIDSEDNFLIIDGSAGSGKTTSIAWGLEYCKEKGLSTNAVAYTGKAASVLREKSNGEHGQTIHSFLYKHNYDLEEIWDSLEEEERESGRKRVLNETPVDVLFIDEASMLSSKVRGFNVNKEKTYLLDELINLQCINNVNKIVFVGDHKQLKPVEVDEYKDSEEHYGGYSDEEEFVSESSVYTDALSEEILKNRYRLSGSTYYCIENYRNKENSSVSKIAFDLAKEITLEGNIDSSPTDWIKEHYPELILSSEEKAFNWLREKRDEVGWIQTRAVTGFNSSVDDINKKIRFEVEGMTGEVGEVRFKNTHPVMNLINRHFVEIYNGDTFFIEETIEENYKTTNQNVSCEKESRGHRHCKEGNTEQFKLSKVKVNLKRTGSEEKEVLMLNELLKLDTPTNERNDRYNLNLWTDFAHRNAELEEKKGSEWYEKLKKDETMNTLLAVHAFATTVHKAQGDEFKYVLVDLDNEQFNLKWLYTAVTRAVDEVKFLCTSQ